MAADIKLKYANSAALTITLNSLANSTTATVGRESTIVDNSTNLYIDAHVTVTAVVGTGTPANNQAVIVYSYASEDGTNLETPCTGSDAAITLPATSSLKVLGSIAIPAQSMTGRQTFSVASNYGGMLPRKWGIVVVNSSGIALSTGCGATYTGVLNQSV